MKKGVGRGIKKSGVPREEIFLETKLWPALYEEENQVEKTLERLDTDYIDLLLLHQPCGNYVKGYQIMEKAVKEGKNCKNIIFYGRRQTNIDCSCRRF